MDENQNVITENNIPEEYKPLSLGKCVGYQILFTIPCLGFILAIVFACGTVKNKNLINWSRAYIIVFVILIALYFILGMLLTGILHYSQFTVF